MFIGIRFKDNLECSWGIGLGWVLFYLFRFYPMQIQKNTFIFILSLIFCSCLVVPKSERASVKNCELETKSWTLEVHEINLNNDCHGCGDFVKGILECGGKSEECITFVAGVSVGWTVIAGSVVVSGNTIHWLEKQGSCKDSVLKNSINKLYSSTVELGGIVVNSSDDLIEYFSKNNQDK